MKPSEEVRKLNGKVGNIIDLTRQYLDAKKVDYTIVKSGSERKSANQKQELPVKTAEKYQLSSDPSVEPGSIIIEKNGKKVIIEQLTQVCGISGMYNDTDEKVNVSAIMDRPTRIIFSTDKGKKNLHVYTGAEQKEPIFGKYLGGGRLTVHMEDILKEPSNTSDQNEAFEINCKCDQGKLSCKSSVWEW
jgi:hypothetical protein